MNPPLHALELFFEVKIIGGKAQLGTDPEMQASQQIIQDLRWMSIEDIHQLPAVEVHTLFQRCQTLQDIYQLKGYLS
jgi:hypothetical protein